MSTSIRRSWTCLRCLRQQQRRFHRRLTTAATATAAKPSPIAYQAASKHDDETIRQIFNSQIFWQEFSEPKKSFWRTERAGLLQNHFLRTPQGFQTFVEATLQKCQRLLDKVLAIATVEEYKKIVHHLDRLSDLLCRVIDLADFVRSTHPDPAYQQQANHAHLRMYDYMNTLNTTPGLYNQLNVALNNSEITSSWSEEELRVAKILWKDFSQSAIALPEAEREAFVKLSGEVNDIGSRFLDGMRPQESQIRLRSGKLQGLDPRFVQRHTGYGGIIKIPTTGASVPHVLNNAQDEATRKEMYIASRTAAEEEVKLLEQLVVIRAKVAKLSGFDSYARMALSDKMAQTPEAVSKFLDALAADNKSYVKAELSDLVKLKQESTGSGIADSNTINAWDREYYRSRMLLKSNKPTRTTESLSSFFSLGTVMQGMSRLFSALYGVRLQPVEPIPGETWSPDVRRLDVLDENDTRLAVLYCDLFARDGKAPNPAHFTLRCSRLITAAEIEEHASQQHELLDRNSAPLDPLALANDGMATTPLSDGSAYQLPTIALICDFPSPKSSKTPPLLPVSSLVTLFHEMGHAIHSILGRTKLQNVSGTRCATDFAELPSILMEHLATNPAVLSLCARHWQTDALLPQDKATQIQQRALAASTAKEAASDTEWQIILSLLDQAYHSPLAALAHFNSDAIAHDIYRRYSSVAEPRETRWQGFFGHLVSYGGSYYSYLFDRAIAARVWEQVFNGGRGNEAVTRENGERFKVEVLSWGGSREPWRCVAGLLKDSRLENGGEQAMEIVGSWGTER